MMDETNGNMQADEANVAEQFRKVFVGGLDAKTTDESLKIYFEKYGEVVDYVVVSHPVTKRPRGFGFVTYKNSSSVDSVQEARPHKVDGRAVETKRAMPKDEDNKPESKVKVNKIFVGGIKEELDEDQLKNYFCTYGNVTNVHIVTDKGSNKKRGFAFVEFDDYDPVDKVVLRRTHHIGKHKTEVKKALSKQQMDEIKRPNDMRQGGGYGNGGGYNNGGNSGGYNSGNQRGGGGGWGMNSSGNGYMGGGYNDFGGDYNSSYNPGPMRGGNQFGGQRNAAPYGGGRGRGGGGFRRF